ncbi:MAG TPA: ABC transporter permease [Gammaproteobacteria bacterium]|nr:ABC transporter permease [Gammaproteobacteria bacterium]
MQRGEPHNSDWRWFEYKKPIPKGVAIWLGVGIWVIFFGVWELSAPLGWVTELLVPSPQAVLRSLFELIIEKGFLGDIAISIYRILISFSVVCIFAVPLGILMGSFASVEAFFNPFVSAWRYLPAPSFIPILLMWFGTGEAPKLALLFIGVVWFLATLVMDHTRQIRNELIETSLTLGGSRLQILASVVIPAVLPNVLTSMRQMLAVSWTYLVIAEIVASTNGIGAMMMRAKRFLHTDEIMAGIVVIGVLGLLFDYSFKLLNKALFPYLEDHR